jgi:hypothetical protein
MSKSIANSIEGIRELYSDSGITMSIILTIYLSILIPLTVAYCIFQIVTTPIYYLIVLILPKGQ